MDGRNEMQETCDTACVTKEGTLREPAPAEDWKAARKHFSRLGLMFFLGVLVIYAAQIGTSFLVAVFKPEWAQDPNLDLILGMIPMYLVGIPVLAALGRLAVPADPVEKHSMKTGHFALSVFMSYAVMIVSNLMGIMITFLIGILKGGMVNNQLEEIATSVHPVVIFLFAVVCAPVIEEYVFRKLIVDRTIRYGQATAVVVSGLMFGLFHGNLNQFIYATALGMFLAFLYCKTGQLKVTVGIHMIVNFMGTVASTLLTEGLDMEELEEQLLTNDYAAMMDFYSAHMGVIVGLLLYGICVIGAVITGMVFWILALVKGRFTFAPGRVALPKGKRFAAVFGNVGMLLFGIFWVIQIVLQLIA